jgi:hypothetical protein
VVDGVAAAAVVVDAVVAVAVVVAAVVAVADVVAVVVDDDAVVVDAVVEPGEWENFRGWVVGEPPWMDHRRRKCDRASWNVFPTAAPLEDGGDEDDDDYYYPQLLLRLSSLSLTTRVDAVH